ncbi:unnamed protein product, partial [Symbiodinium sp. KB8]
ADGMSTTGGAVTKTKDGVPQWSGEAQSFTEYEEQCLLYEQSVEYYKRYMVAPRLISELQGPAKRLVIGKKPDWVSFPGGVQVLLNTLRASLGKPQVSEMADYLTKYFRQTRRKSQESMSDYITRKCEVYLRAQQALKRAYLYYLFNQTSVESNEGGAQAATPVAEASTMEAPAKEEAGSDPGSRSQWSDWQWNTWGSAWTGGWQGYQSYWTNDWWRAGGPGYGNKGIEEDGPTEILPDFVQGWYLLFDASLSTTERNLIHTAVQGDYSLQRIAQELRAQWDDNNIRQRDNRHQTSYLGEDDEPGYEEEAETMEGFAAEHLTEEGQALVAEAETNKCVRPEDGDKTEWHRLLRAKKAMGTLLPGHLVNNIVDKCLALAQAAHSGDTQQICADPAPLKRKLLGRLQQVACQLQVAPPGRLELSAVAVERASRQAGYAGAGNAEDLLPPWAPAIPSLHA